MLKRNDIIMNVCHRCERFFTYKNSLRRHQQKRRNPCRPAVASCTQCGNKFTSLESLKKHKIIYCKGNQCGINLEDYLNQLPSGNNISSSSPYNNSAEEISNNHHQLHTPQSLPNFTPISNAYFDSDTLQELLNQIQFSPMMINSSGNNNNVNITTTKYNYYCI